MIDVNFFLILIATTVVGTISTAMLYYALGYFVSERFVDPSFDFNIKRLSEYVMCFFIFSLVILAVLKLLVSHFHLPEEFQDSPSMVIIPALIVLMLRSIVRYQSSRIAREHLNTIIFILLVSVTAKIIFLIAHAEKISLDLFPPRLIGAILLSSFIVPLIGDLTLVGMEKFPYIGFIIRQYIIKDKKLIDITDELPITLEFISGKENIDKAITKIIRKGDHELRIITKHYGTIANNLVEIKERCRRGGNIRIMGAPSQSADIEQRILGLQKELNSLNIALCECPFDDMRVVIDDNNKIIVTFATGGYEGSHVGIYSEHPFVISLFKNYFDTKCNSKKCSMCKNMQNCLKNIVAAPQQLNVATEGVPIKPAI